VLLTPEKTVRLIRKELGTYIGSKIINAPTPPMIPGFENMVNELISICKKLTPSYTMTTGEYPPCIKHAIEVLEKGENLPHSGRFMLATFLLSKGQSVEEIAPLFKNAPDYNQRVTLYQLNHLAGTSGSGTHYSCPSCEKLKTQNLCFAIPECDNIINPIQFGKKRI
jgi:DNA primase large subunit